MNPATAELLAEALNGAFTLIAAWRRKGMTDAQIAERLSRADAGEAPVTVQDVIEAENAWQDAIDEGRQIP